MMSLRFPSIGAVCAVVLAVAAPAAAGPPPGTLELRYAGTLVNATQVADSSGKGLHGAILTGGGGALTSVVEADGDPFLRFPGGTCAEAPCPQAIIRPNPGSPSIGASRSVSEGLPRLPASCMSSVDLPVSSDMTPVRNHSMRGPRDLMGQPGG